MSSFCKIEPEIERFNTARYRSPIMRVQKKNSLNKLRYINSFYSNTTNNIDNKEYDDKNKINPNADFTGQNTINNCTSLNKSNSVVNYNKYCKNIKNDKKNLNNKTPIKRNRFNNSLMEIKTNEIYKYNENNNYINNKTENNINTNIDFKLKTNNNNLTTTYKKLEKYLKKKNLSTDETNPAPALTISQNDNNYYCIKCYNRKQIPIDNLKIPFKNLNKSYDSNYYHATLELKKIDEDYICNKVLENEQKQLRAFNNLQNEKFNNEIDPKAKLQYINENEDNTQIGLNLQDYLYYNNKKNNEFLNNSMIDNISLYKVNKPRKAVNDYYKKVQYQIPILEKSHAPSTNYKNKYIETLKKQIDDKEREKNKMRKLKIKKEMEENKKYDEFLSKLKRDEKEQKRLKQQIILDNNKYMKEYQKRKEQIQKKDNQNGYSHRTKMFNKNQKDYLNFINQQKTNEINSLQYWINENVRQKQKKINCENNDTRKWDAYNKAYLRKYNDNTYAEKCTECNSIYPMNKLMHLPKKSVNFY